MKNSSRLSSIHENVLVQGRHLALPLSEYLKEMSFDEKNDHFLDKSILLAEEAITSLLQSNGLEAKEISALWSNTITGFSIPSLDARIMNLIPFAPNTKRLPIMGLGCMAGAAGINRASEYLRGHPKDAIIFFTVELCSLTVQMSEISVANMISTGLFGDGAAAVLMVGDEHPFARKAHLEWISSESVFFPETEDLMGWNVGGSGLKLILNKSIPKIAEKMFPVPLSKFLQKHFLNLGDIRSFFIHPGGPKILETLENSLGLPEKALKHSWESLSKNGNMSSVSILDVFKRAIDAKPGRFVGTHALSVAMGPGFSAEIGLFKWR